MESGDKREVFIDTNFFMIPFQFNVDMVRLAAGLGLKIAQSGEIEIRDIPLNDGESVDDALIRVSNVLATNDANLRKKAKKKGIALVILRQRKYLAVEGYLI